MKAAPGMSNTVYKVTQGHDVKETASPFSPERRGGGPAAAPGLRGSAGSPTPGPERLSPTYGQPMGIEWNKANAAELMRSNIGGASSKFQALGLYDHKPNMFHGAANSNLTPKGPAPAPVNDGKLNLKQRTPPQFLNKFTDFFKDKEAYRSPSPLNSTGWGGPDLCQPEPESQQSPPPPPSPGAVITRNDNKRLTLGHSKLDLVNKYNKKTRPVYSRFELKSTN